MGLKVFHAESLSATSIVQLTANFGVIVTPILTESLPITRDFINTLPIITQKHGAAAAVEPQVI